MSKATKNIDALLARQEEILQGLKQEAKALDTDAITVENERLTKSLAEEREKNERLAQSESELKKELQNTKNALFAKMADEKLAAFSRVQQRIDSEYYLADETTMGKLLSYEQNCRRSIGATQKAIEHYGEQEFGDISHKLNALYREFEEKRIRIDAYRKEQLGAARQHNNEIGEKLKNEPLTEMEKKNAEKQGSIEAFIGLNILSKLGILLLLVGIVLLGRFAYTHMSDVLKGVLIYALGGVLIGGGELFHRKEKTVFSTALISGGVAVLYAATATSLFAFKLFDEQMAFIVCIVVTAIAIAISNQIKSWIVCAFATVGGYLPLIAAFMISFGAAAASKTYLPAAAAYFLLLSAVVFILTKSKKWYAAQFIGYAFQIVAVSGITSCAWALHQLVGFEHSLALAVAFAVASYLIYLAMPALKIIKKQELDAPDLVLLGLNTLSGAISVSVTLYNCFGNGTRGNRAVGFAFVVFAAIYALLSVFSTKKKNENATVASAVLYTSALIFSMLIVPFLFGWKYAALAWAAEGAVLAVISVKKNLRIPEYAGLACMVLSFIPYVAEGVSYSSTSNYPPLAIITLCIILVSFWAYTVTGLSADKNRLSYFAIFEILSALGTFAYLIYLYHALLSAPKVTFSSDFTNAVAYAVFSLITALCIRFGVLKNKVSIGFSDVAGVLIALYTFISIDIVNNYQEINNYFVTARAGGGLETLNLILLIVINLAALLFFSKAVSNIINELNASVWIYTASIAILVLAMLTAILMCQFDVAFSSVIISGVYIAAACVLLAIGFRKKFSVVRLGGLIMILVAFAKLLFIDARGLEVNTGFKIASYFIYGGILIGISYIYQRFSKKLTE